MDTHPRPNPRLGHPLPHRHGARRTSHCNRPLPTYSDILQCDFILTIHPDHPLPLARPPPDKRHPPRPPGLLPRPLAPRPPIRPQPPRPLRKHPDAHPPRPSQPRHLLKAPPRTRFPRPHPPAHRPRPRRGRKTHARPYLDTIRLRRFRLPRFLFRRPHRPMCCALHHGFRIHRIRHHPYHPLTSRPTLDQTHRSQSRILRQRRNRSLGLHKHLHRAPLGQRMGRQRPATHLHGRNLVVRGPSWDLAEP